MRLRTGGRSFAYSGRVVIITGGSRGLGLLMAHELKKKGARLALLARDREELMRAKEDLDGGTVLAITCDVGDRGQVRQAVDIVLQHFGRIDVLINNAGVIQVGPLQHMTYGDYHQAMNVHFWGALHCTEAVLPHMRHRRSGRIVNIASVGGLVAVPHLAPYTASKFALVGYSNAVRAEVAKEGICVTTVCPGLMRTGSAINAQMKGRHEAEFAWFAALSSLPLVSINARRAARKIRRRGAAGHAEPHDYSSGAPCGDPRTPGAEHVREGHGDDESHAAQARERMGQRVVVRIRVEAATAAAPRHAACRSRRPSQQRDGLDAIRSAR